jgi:hypothetical protein
MGMNPRLLRPTPTGFDPRRIAGLEVWLDASDVSTVTLNGGNVSEWRSKVGSRTFTQSTAAAQPIYATAFRNGRNALQFDLARRLVSTQAASAWRFIHAEKIVMFAVSRTNTGGNNAGTIASTFDDYAGTGKRGVHFFFDQRNVNLDKIVCNSIRSIDVSYAWANELAGVTGGNLHALQFVSDPGIDGNTGSVALQRMRIRTSTVTTANTSGAVTFANSQAADDPTQTMSIGSQSSASTLIRPLSGHICEILIYRGESARLATERLAIRNYLVAKWAI